MKFFFNIAITVSVLGIVSGGVFAQGPAAKDKDGYRLVWADEFNKEGRPDSSNWDYERGFVRNEEWQWYQPENAVCKDGLLVIEAKKEIKPNPRYAEGSNDWRRKRQQIEYASACLITRGKQTWQYGRFEMRGRISIRDGIWPAWWTLGIDKRWPGNGEIDIMEYYRGKLLANIACLGANGKAEWFSNTFSTDSLGGNAWANQFHTWRMDWTEEYIALFVDDILLNKVSLDLLTNKDGSGFNPFKQPHYMLLNLALGGMNGGDASKTDYPQKFEIDYVRVYQKDTLPQKRVPNQPVFKVKEPDNHLSPFTGMTRKHWKDAALYLLNGAFSYIDQLDDPMQFPKQPGKSYPRNIGQERTEKLEGLCRTLFIAAPLLKENPSLQCHNIRVADYYRYQIVQLLNPASATYIKPQAKGGGPSQTLVEFGGLAVSLFYIPEILFDPLTKGQKDSLAVTMLSYGDGKTVGSNWKYFNIFVLSFFKSRGYAVNEALLKEYLDKTLQHYRSNGWYNDAPAYDYYSMWAFQMYGPLWVEFFGKKYYPEYAAQIMKNFKEVKSNYPYLFARDGKMIMWGRSMSYRMAAAVPFPLMGLENDPSINYGWMRRIASSVMLQFVANPHFLSDNIPTLGFYEAFEPAVQPYSCRGSVFWMGKIFLGLMIPEDNPFWKATENEGDWNSVLKKGNVYNKYQDSSHILITDYPNIGAAEVRAWCKVKAIGANEPFRASENYNRLSYNSAFPWQADSVDGVVSMNYIFRNRKNEWEPLRLYDFKRFGQGIYYRDAVLETNAGIKLSLADIPLPNGILRVDKITSDTITSFKLGHYALPDIGAGIKESKRLVNGSTVNIIDNGEYQLAMVILNGWKEMTIAATKGVNPVSEKSKVINASGMLEGKSKVYATLMLWKRTGEKWSNEELMPVQSVKYKDDLSNVTIRLNRTRGNMPAVLQVNW